MNKRSKLAAGLIGGFLILRTAAPARAEAVAYLYKAMQEAQEAVKKSNEERAARRCSSDLDFARMLDRNYTSWFSDMGIRVVPKTPADKAADDGVYKEISDYDIERLAVRRYQARKMSCNGKVSPPKSYSGDMEAWAALQPVIACAKFDAMDLLARAVQDSKDDRQKERAAAKDYFNKQGEAVFKARKELAAVEKRCSNSKEVKP